MEVEDEWYQGSKLESILCLMSHEDKLTQVEFQLAIFHSIRVVFYLLTCTDFFLFKLNREKTHDMYIIRFMLENPELMFTGKLLTKLSYIIRRNSFKVIFNNNFIFIKLLQVSFVHMKIIIFPVR